MTKYPSFAPGENVHWIQAKRAAQDLDSWRDGWVVAISARRVTVAFRDGTRRRYRSRTGALTTAMANGMVPGVGEACRAGVAERWRLMAVSASSSPRSGFVTRLEDGAAVEAVDVDSPTVLLSIAPSGDEDARILTPSDLKRTVGNER
jgi:hypothetical protein